MIKQLLFFYFLFILCFSFSQTERKYILGKVIADSLSVENIHIVNKTSGIATLSNKLGEFKILTKQNDTILFSSVHFMNKEIIIKKEYFNKLQLVVKLEIDINFLDEVTIKNHNFTGNLTIDVQNHQDSIHDLSLKVLDFSGIDFSKAVVDDLDEVDRSKAPDPSKLTTPEVANGVNVFGLVVSPLIKKISKLGEKKRKRKIIEYESTKVPDKIRSEFNNHFFVSELKMPISEIDAFISHCMNKGLAKLYLENKKIELIELMLNESSVFLNSIKNEKK